MNCVKHAFVEHKGVVILLLVFGVYFLFMDIALYFYIQSREPAPVIVPSRNVNLPAISSESTSQDGHYFFSPFHGLTIKGMMLNHANHYIHEPLSAIFDEVLHFSEVFYFITPHMISAFGVIAASVSGYMVSSNVLVTRQMAVLVFQLRSFMDALDGGVARARRRTQIRVSTFGSAGYYVDGVADGVGLIAFLLGIIVYLNRQPIAKLGYSILPTWSKPSTVDTGTPRVYKERAKDHLPPTGQTAAAICRSCMSIGRGTTVVMCFGVLLIASAYFWNHYISEFYKLLELPPTNERQAVLQIDAMKTSLMWIILWMWRLCNFFTFMDMLCVAVLIDRIWDFLTWVRFLGFTALAVLVIVTEIYLQSVQNHIMMVAVISSSIGGPTELSLSRSL